MPEKKNSNNWLKSLISLLQETVYSRVKLQYYFLDLRRLSLRLSGRGGVLPLRNSKSPHFLAKIKYFQDTMQILWFKVFKKQRSGVNNNCLFICTDEAFISVTHTHNTLMPHFHLRIPATILSDCK